MLIKRTQGWELKEHEVTDEKLYVDRRNVLAGLGVGLGAIGAGPALAPTTVFAATSDARYPAKRSAAYPPGRAITPEEIASRYNNFYEFGSSKQIAAAAQALPTDPWAIRIDGLVENERTISFEDLEKKFSLEERVYRHRCVEAWSMVAPWTGFPLSALVKFARPLSKAKYVRMETFQAPEIARGQRATWYPWPYVEGLTMAEAMNDLSDRKSVV